MNDEINESRQSPLPHGAGFFIALPLGIVFWTAVAVWWLL